MGESITLFSYNILATGTTTVTGSPDTGYGAERLYDKSKNFLWKDTDNIARTVQIDQGASDIKDIDLLWIVNHNFDGLAMTWEWSDNGSAWTESASWTQSGYGAIVKTIGSAITHRYWKVTIEAFANALCGEIYMSGGYGFGVIARPVPAHGYEDNVAWSRAIGGQERGIKLGEVRERRLYTLRLGSSDLTNLLSVVGDLDGFSKPLLVKDKDGNYYLMRFDPLPSKEFIINTRTEVEISLVEMA